MFEISKWDANLILVHNRLSPGQPNQILGTLAFRELPKRKKPQKTQNPTVDLYSLMYCPFLCELVLTLDLGEILIRGRSDAQRSHLTV